VFVRALIGNACARLSAPILDPRDHHGAAKMLLTADQMRSLPDYFADVPDPRRGQGRRHPLPAALGIAAGAVLCGARGYKAIAAWAADLSQQARARFRCRYRNGRYEVPSRTRFRDLLISIPPEELDRALQGWNTQMASADEGLALDGKTMRNAIDEAGQQTHILGAVGHQSQACYAQKKSPPYP
jgi:hypothetical protein